MTEYQAKHRPKSVQKRGVQIFRSHLGGGDRRPNGRIARKGAEEGGVLVRPVEDRDVIAACNPDVIATEEQLSVPEKD